MKNITERPKQAIIKRKTLRFRYNRIRANIFNFFNRGKLDYEALDKEESLKLLLESGKSYIRFGNGESEILVGLDMSTQVYVKELEEDLKKIINEYSPESNYYLGLVNWALKMSVKEMKTSSQKNLFHIWRFMRYVFYRLNMHIIKMPFLEADMFRIGNAELPRDKIELLWAEKTSIIVVYNNEEKYEKFRKNQKGKAVYFVRIPDKNFFGILPETQEKIQRIITDNDIKNDELVVLVAAGPGSNVLCYNLCQRDDNLLCYDMGNFFHLRYMNKSRD